MRFTDLNGREREMVASYLGWNAFRQGHEFSLRPHAGTVCVPTITSAQFADGPVRLPVSIN